VAFHSTIKSECADEISAAYDWYELQEPGLGRQYVSEIDAVIDKVTDHPFAYIAVMAISIVHW
jgi:hypothetical protein